MIGLDIGGTKMELAIFNDALELQDSWRTPTPTENYLDFLSAVEAMVTEADSRLGHKGSVGVGVPGFIDENGECVSGNVRCINGRSVGTDLSEKLLRQVTLDNDTKNFVFSEANGGAGDGVHNVLGLVLGTGLAGNQSIAGRLVRGANGLAGEFGHVPMAALTLQRYNFPLLKCGCGAMGCVEPYMSGPGLLWMSRHFGGSFKSVIDIVDGVRQRDATASKTFSAYLDCLGLYVAQLLHIFDPDILVIGGGLSKIDEIFERLADAVEQHIIPGFRVAPVVPPQFGDSSGVRGAAMLGRAAMRASNA